MKPIGQALREAREVTGLSQTTLAAQLGLSKQFVSMVECGERPMPEKYWPLLPEPMRELLVDDAIAMHEREIDRIRMHNGR